MECTDEGGRICSNCNYEIEDPELIRCPRCYNLLLKKCSECNKCNFFNKQ